MGVADRVERVPFLRPAVLGALLLCVGVVATPIVSTKNVVMTDAVARVVHVLLLTPAAAMEHLLYAGKDVNPIVPPRSAVMTGVADRAAPVVILKLAAAVEHLLYVGKDVNPTAQRFSESESTIPGVSMETFLVLARTGVMG